jgi:hypothetical protein
VILANTPGNLTQITRVFVDSTNPDGPGTIRIYLAGDSGEITGDTLTVADAYLQSRRGLCAVLATQGSIDDTVVVTARVRCRAGFKESAKAAIQDALQEYRRSLSIGDGVTVAGVVYRAQIVEILMAPEGVVDVPLGMLFLAGQPLDYAPAKGHLAAISWTNSNVGDGGSIQFEEI